MPRNFWKKYRTNGADRSFGIYIYGGTGGTGDWKTWQLVMYIFSCIDLWTFMGQYYATNQGTAMWVSTRYMYFEIYSE